MTVKTIARTCFVLVAVFGRMPIASAAPVMQVDDAPLKLSALERNAQPELQQSILGLFSIPSWRQHQIQQPFSQFDELYQHAEIAQHEMISLLSKTQKITETQIILPGLKGKLRAQEKIESELGGQADKLTDIVRASIVADSIPDLVKAYDEITQHSTLLEVNNRFATPAKSGYRDLKLLVRLPESKHIAEIQLHLSAIAEVKSGPEHKIYEEVQGIERLAQQQNRVLNDIEQATIDRLRATSQRLYQESWQHYLSPQKNAVNA